MKKRKHKLGRCSECKNNTFSVERIKGHMVSFKCIKCGNSIFITLDDDEMEELCLMTGLLASIKRVVKILGVV